MLTGIPMLRARLSYRLFGLAMRILPSGLAAKLTNFLRLKTPAPPDFLGAMLMGMSANILKDLDGQLANSSREHPDLIGSLSEEEAEHLLVELLCALGWLALHIMSFDDFGREPNFFGVYASLTFQELEELLEQERAVALLRQIGEETRELYLSDNPTLRELAADNDVIGWYEELIEKSEREQNWLWSYCTKAEIRIMAKLPVGHHSYYYQRLGTMFAIAMTNSVDAFKKLRPALAPPGQTIS